MDLHLNNELNITFNKYIMEFPQVVFYNKSEKNGTYNSNVSHDYIG
jgi:hypothetical protein